MAYKRKNYMVKRSFQMRLLVRIFAVIALILALLTGSLFVVNNLAIRKAQVSVGKHIEQLTANDDAASTAPGKILNDSVKISKEVRRSLDELTHNMIRAFVASLVLSLLLTATFFLLLSHRIAGPIYRIERSIQGVEQGDLTMRVYLRDKDEFKDLGDLFNSMTGNLNDRVNKVQQAVIQLQIDIEKESIDGEAKRRLIDRVAALENLLKQFKITYS